jgi:hypothetical protein
VLERQLTPDTATLEDLERWMSTNDALGVGAGGRLRKTAVSRFIAVLAPDEPRQLVWILNNLDELQRRLLTDDGQAVTTATATTYASRLRVSAGHLFKWLSDSPSLGGAPPEERQEPRLARDDRSLPQRSTREGWAGQRVESSGSSHSQSAKQAKLRAEIGEALAMLPQWPTLAVYLMEGLLKAMQAAEGEGGGAPLFSRRLG